MNNQTAIREPKKKHAGYAKCLEAFGCPLVYNPPFIHIGDIQHHKRWLIYISCNVYQMEDLLQRIMPVLAEYQVPFRIPVGKNELNEINSGEYGFYLTGCAVTIYPRTNEEANILALELVAQSKSVRGIAVPHALHLGNTVYANYATVALKGKKKGMVRFRLPKRHPFGQNTTYPASRPRLLNGRYIPVYIYNNRPKGDIYKAVDVQGLAFKWCFIKQGKAEATLDERGRAMRERLLWQQEVLRHLNGWAHAPRFLDYFEKGKDAYLVTELVWGEVLFDWIKKTLNTIPFRDHNEVQKYDILEVFCHIVEAIGELHELGYIHRDITDNNFIISKRREISLVDFELSYSLTNDMPSFPFTYGTPGYVSPQQAKGEVPTVKDDIFSLGNLLLFMLTGDRPESFFERHGENASAVIAEITGNETFGKLISICRATEPDERPSITDLEQIARRLLIIETDDTGELKDLQIYPL